MSDTPETESMTKTEAFKLLYGYRIPEGAIEAYEALERDRLRLIETLSNLVGELSWYERRKKNLGEPVIWHGSEETWADVLTRDLAPARALLKELL